MHRSVRRPLRLRAVPLRRPASGMRRPDAFEALFRARRFLAVRRHLDHALPRLRGAFEILLAPGADDADVEQRLRMCGIDRQRPLELLQRAVRLIGVVVGDPEVGADVRRAADRSRAPPDTSGSLRRSARRRSTGCRAAPAASALRGALARPRALSCATRFSSRAGGAPPAGPAARLPAAPAPPAPAAASRLLSCR